MQATSTLAQVATGSQYCKRCTSNKPIAEFSRHPKSTTGVYSICDTCRSAAISTGRQAANKRKRAAAEIAGMEAALAVVIPEPDIIRPVIEIVEAAVTQSVARRIGDATAEARGMAMLDPRLAPHAALLQSILDDVLETA